MTGPGHSPHETHGSRMDGLAALRILSRVRKDQPVITTMSTIHDWSVVSARRDLDVHIIRPMAECGPLGIGLALGRPDIEFWVLDGDGSLLMNLGCLVTMAHMSPPNLVYVVYENGTYDTTGGQPVPGAGRVDFPAIARACGLRNAARFSRLEDLENGLDAFLAGPRPAFLTLGVAPAPRRPFPELTDTGPSLRRLAQALTQRRPGPPLPPR